VLSLGILHIERMYSVTSITSSLEIMFSALSQEKAPAPHFFLLQKWKPLMDICSRQPNPTIHFLVISLLENSLQCCHPDPSFLHTLDMNGFFRSLTESLTTLFEIRLSEGGHSHLAETSERVSKIQKFKISVSPLFPPNLFPFSFVPSPFSFSFWDNLSNLFQF